MINIDLANPRFDLLEVVYAALADSDRERLRFLAAGSIGVPLSLKVPGWLRVTPPAPPAAVAAAERLLGVELPAACLTRLALEDATSIMAALARLLHSSAVEQAVVAEIEAWDALCDQRQIRVRRTDDGWHRIQCGRAIAFERSFPDVLTWLGAHLAH